jgi:hypothetical protein
MKSIATQRAVIILNMVFMVMLLLLAIDGCKKDDGPTGPFSPPTYPNMAGRWTGTGSWWDSFTINVTWIADFTQQTDSTFSGVMTDTYTAPSSMSGYSLKWYVKGTATMAGRVVMAETSVVKLNWPISDMYIPNTKTFSQCVLSAQRDTMTYSGPGPQPSGVPETFVLVKQK